MIQEQLNTVQKALIDELTKAVKIVMVKRGIETNSNLIKSVDWEWKNNAFVMLANDYFTYASEGRRPRARKVPIDDLLPWIKKYRIRPRKGQTINELAFAIQTSIYKNGIKKKGYLDPVEVVSVDLISEGTAEGLSEIIAENIAKAISN